MKTSYILVFFLILITSIYSQCCLRFEGKKCISCQPGTHIFRGNCILDVKDCLTYKDGFDCETCNNGFQLNSTGDCDKISTVPVPTAINNTYTDVLVDPKNIKGSSADTYIIAD